MIIKEGAIFIADAHYDYTKREELIDFLKEIQLKERECSQLFLMGDIFDFLCDEVDYFQEINYKLIDLIDTISHQIETIYFEGNHDYSLEDTFPKVRVIPRVQQPVLCQLNNRKIALAHGDIFTPKGYEIYTALIRNHYFLNFLNFLDFGNLL